MRDMPATFEGERIGLFHYRVSAESWQHLIRRNERMMSLLAFWADEDDATALFLVEGERPLLVSTAVKRGHYLAASEYYPTAQWGERIARDLWGVEAWSALDDSPALDDGSWSITAPMSAHPFPVAEGGGQPLPRCRITPTRSPVPGLLGVQYELADGRMEQVELQIAAGHRGVLSQLKGIKVEEALPLIARISAAGFVTHPLAFVRAVEQAQGQVVDAKERDRRLILLEIERLSLHLFDLAQTAEAAQIGLLASLCDHTREAIAQICERYGLGRRLTDTIHFVTEPSSYDEAVMGAFIDEVSTSVRHRLPLMKPLSRLFENRLKSLGVIPTEQAWDYALGGVTGRASGRYLDMRYMSEGARLHAMGGAGRHEGDAWARNRQRFAELEESLRLLEQIMEGFGQPGEEHILPKTGEGLGVAEGARGDVWYWVKLQAGKIESIQMRDPAVPLLAVLGQVMEGHYPDQLRVILASLGISPAGMAL